MTEGIEWQGRVGDTWAHEWQRTDRSFADLSHHLDAAILAAAPETGRAIDLGCGAGQTSIALAKARPGLNVTGIDLSEDLISVARHRSAGIANLDFRVGDTSALDSSTASDLLFSRHGVMFFADPVAAFTNIRKAAKPGAAIVFSCFADRARNEWVGVLDGVGGQGAPATEAYAPGPFAFSDRDWTARMLADAGWIDAGAVAVDYTYLAGAGDNAVLDARSFFMHIGPTARLLADAAPDRREILLDRLVRALERHESGGQVRFRAAAWIWTAHAGEAA